jgi:hypothetical protein
MPTGNLQDTSGHANSNPHLFTREISVEKLCICFAGPVLLAGFLLAGFC